MVLDLIVLVNMCLKGILDLETDAVELSKQSCVEGLVRNSRTANSLCWWEARRRGG